MSLRLHAHRDADTAPDFELSGPGPHPRPSPAWHLPTGGGIVALVSRTLGLQGIGTGPETWWPVADVVEGPAPDSLPHDPVLLTGPGSWERRLGTRDGPVLERGLVTEAGIVIVEAREGDQVMRHRYGLVSHRLAEEEARTRLERGSSPLPAREAQRRGRTAPGIHSGIESGLEAGPGPHEAGEEHHRGAMPPPEPCIGALQALDEAALSLDPEGRPRGPFVAGVTGVPHQTRPAWISGGALAETGLAALLTGRFELADALLDTALSPGDLPPPPPIPLVVFAARWVHWQGRPQRLLPALPLLERAVEQVVDAAPDDAGAAWPSPSRALELLARALEPVRGSLAGSLEARARHLRQGPGPSGGAIRLPVLGSQAPDVDAAPPRPDASQLPPLEAFAPVEHPGVLGRRTVHAARALRSWLEGRWGLDADAHVGRIRIAPWIPRALLEEAGGEMGLRGLRVADARLDIACRGEGGRLTFAFSQSGGRVPLRVVFEPHLPGIPGAEVRSEGGRGEEASSVDVTMDPEDGPEGAPGLRLRVQFPLDSKRRILVDGIR